MKKRIFGLILAVVMMLSCFTGCAEVKEILSPIVGEEIGDVAGDVIGGIGGLIEDNADDVINNLGGLVNDALSEENQNPITDSIKDLLNDMLPGLGDTMLNGWGDLQNALDSGELDVDGYNGKPYETVNGNVPYFTDEQKQVTEAFEIYSDKDSLGRCGVAFANICKELMPTEDRESISSVKPSGWKNKEYDFVDGRWVYNRCHIIGFQLAGENANDKNLITGTRYMNVEGMLPFENMIDDYVDETGNHVLYRVTPVYTGDNLVCDGVIMEAWSVEDEGDGICFNVFCYNVQPGVVIDYATGENHAE